MLTSYIRVDDVTSENTYRVPNSKNYKFSLVCYPLFFPFSLLLLSFLHKKAFFLYSFYLVFLSLVVLRCHVRIFSHLFSFSFFFSLLGRDGRDGVNGKKNKGIF